MTTQVRTTPSPVLLVGNPNVGKSVIFGALTRRYVTVSNYPGTTVEIARGRAVALPNAPELIDSPGTNSLTPQSEDEKVTRDLLLAEPSAPVIQVGDTKNLGRVLYLTAQLAELGRPQVLVLNLQDEAGDLGVKVNAGALEVRLGIPVIPATATRWSGLDDVAARLACSAPAKLAVTYPASVEDSVAKISGRLPGSLGPMRRGLALMLLARDRTLGRWAAGQLDAEARAYCDRVIGDLEATLGQRAAGVIARSRHRVVGELLSQVFSVDRASSGSVRDRLGSLAMHPVWGVPVLVAALAVAYLFVGEFGAGTLVGWVENGVFGSFINPGATVLVTVLLPAGWMRDVLVGPYGLVTMALTYAVAIVLPVVGTFFIFFGALEDSGYLPRLAVMVNRLFHAMGLNGKAVLPMILGLGCDTMATLTTRILASRKERVLVTLLLALGVPCSAQLAVILAILGSVSFAGTLIWLLVIAGTLFGVGWAAARLVPGRGSDFLMEVPPLRWPSPVNIVVKTLARTEWYLKEAVPLFALGTLLLFVLDRLGALGRIEGFAEPLVVGLLGLPARTTDAFLIGFLRRDYGAAGLFAMREQNLLSGNQAVVSLVVITLFVPCIANFLVMLKERGFATTLAIVAFIVPFAFAVGAALNAALGVLGILL